MPATSEARINGVHHLAVSTADIKGQIEYFTKVLGMRLTALYWMHGVEGAWHGFLELNDRSSVAFVQMPKNAEGKSELGDSHAANGGSPSAPGTMQHVAFGVETPEALIALRNRIRSHGVPVFGPVDHGFCQSIYFAGPEGLNLEISTSDAPIDAESWIDPEVVALAGISEAELKGYLAPEASPPSEPHVLQPAYDPAKPHMRYPAERYQAMLQIPDDVYAARASYNEPPVRKSQTAGA
jgi:catechol 2,3-dioxygenase-like lactoylglutathione lyase family enzyme